MNFTYFQAKYETGACIILPFQERFKAKIRTVLEFDILYDNQKVIDRQIQLDYYNLKLVL